MMLQKERKFLGLNADFLGLLSSLLCAVHCLAMPLVSSLGLTLVGHHNHFFDFIFLALGLVFAGFSLFKDYFKHRHIIPFILGVVGFLLLSVGISTHLPVLSVIGGIVVATSHILNYRLKSKSV